ncbi:MAG TPA: xanthine dehydrogenase family protein subunit M [Terriglobales bacterium]|nr:xanthine dehydrogenase family protein subunit M [Terriglobales bacterium]
MPSYFRPDTLAEATAFLAQFGGTILAGGTDYFPQVLGKRPASPVVDISGLTDLEGIQFFPQHITIGALTTWTTIAQTKLPPCFEGLQAAASEVGSIQIQNRATIAGNLCNASPAADGCPCLLALDAEVKLASASGVRRMPLNDFLIGNRRTKRRADEILTAIILPRDVENAASSFLKLGARRYLVISIAMVAAVLSVDEKDNISKVRVAVGSCSARALRLRELESEIVGLSLAEGFDGIVEARHLASLSPIDDVRGTAEYRSDATLTLIRRTLEECAEKLRT